MKKITTIGLLLTLAFVHEYSRAIGSTEAVSGSSANGEYTIKIGEKRWLNNECLEVAEAGKKSKVIPLNQLESGPDRYYCGGSARYKTGVEDAYQNDKNNQSYEVASTAKENCERSCYSLGAIDISGRGTSACLKSCEHL